MLSLSKKTDYALIALWHLAKHEEQVISARDMADRYRVPLPILTNVLKLLARGDLIRSVRGSRGGYALEQKPHDVTLLDVVTLIDGQFQLAKCVELSGDNFAHDLHQGDAAVRSVMQQPCEDTGENSPVLAGCGLAGCCPVREPVKRLHERFEDFLRSVTLADLLVDHAVCVTVGVTIENGH